jgi:hypothetical protein
MEGVSYKGLKPASVGHVVVTYGIVDRDACMPPAVFDAAAVAQGAAAYQLGRRAHACRTSWRSVVV